ncbi:MAG: Ig-like domain-containing protein [Armatimonadetes bacterium]|nr:Ig-like domain-containing protein [Armatimonadota bacterium]
MAISTVPYQPGSATVSVDLKFDGKASPINQLEYVIDEAPTGSDAGNGRPLPDDARTISPSEITFNVSAANWNGRSSHSIYVRQKAPGASSTSWQGTMVSIIPAGSKPIALTYYRDYQCTQPFPTPDGTPLIPAGASCTVKLTAPEAAAYRIEPASDGVTGRTSPLPMQSITRDEAITSWSPDAAVGGSSRLGLNLIDSEGRPIEISAGAYIFVGQPASQKIFISLSATPDTLNADGRSTAQIVATVTDANGLPISGRSVEFQRLSGGGSLMPETIVTDRNGQVRARYLAGVTADTAVIQACDETTQATGQTMVRLRISGSTSIQLCATGSGIAGYGRSPLTGGLLNMSVVAYPDQIPADGVSTSNVEVQVTNPQGAPVSGVQLQFKASGYNGRILPIKPITDSSGHAAAIYVAGSTPGDVTVTAVTLTGQSSGAVTIHLTGGGAAKVTVQANPAILPADGRSVSQVLVRVTDLFGRPVPNATVQLSVQSGLGILTTGSSQTDATGEVLATFHGGRIPGIEQVSAVVLSPLPNSLSELGALPALPAGRSTSASPYGSKLAVGPSPLLTSAPMDTSGLGFAPTSAMPGMLVAIINNLAISYGHWEEFLSMKGPNVTNSHLHLQSNSWNIRFKRPVGLGFGGLSFYFGMDRNESAEYGYVSRYTDATATLRASARYFEFLSNLTQTDTGDQDLRTGISINGSASSALFSLTFQVPRLPILNVTRYSAKYSNGSGDGVYSFTDDRTTTSIFKRFGDLGITWLGSWEGQSQFYGGTNTSSGTSYSNAGLTYTRQLIKGLNVGLTLSQVGTHIGGGAPGRDTNQTQSDLTLNFAPTSNFSASVDRSTNGVADSAYANQTFGSTTQSYNLSYLPWRFLALQAGMQTNDQSMLGGQSSFRTRNFSSTLQLTTHTSLSFNLTHAEQPELAPLLTGQSTNSRSLQMLTTSILPNTDLTLGWTQMSSASLGSTSYITTRSAQVDSRLTRTLRGTISAASSSLSGLTSGSPFTLNTNSENYSLVWTPNLRTQLSYAFTRLNQSGLNSTSSNLDSTLRLSTIIHSRLYLVLEASDNALNQTVLLTQPVGTSYAGRLFSLQLNYSVSPGSYLFVEYDKSHDDLSGFDTKSIRLGYGSNF